MRRPAAGAREPRSARRYRRLSPGPGTDRAAVRAHQRGRIIAATFDLVAERGYGKTTVREIAALAGVSKASFYEQFDGKAACFVAALDVALREAARVLMPAAAGGPGDRERLRAGLIGLADLLAEQPQGARSVLVESMGAPPEVRSYLRRRFGLLEALVRERLAAAPLAGKLPRALTTGIVRGIAHHATRCVRLGVPEQFRTLVDPLLDWGLSFHDREVLVPFAAPCAPEARSPRWATVPESWAELPTTRDLLTSAALRLALNRGIDALTPTRIRRAAGVAKRDFDAYFQDETACILAALDERIDELLSTALRKVVVDDPWVERIRSLLAHVTELLAADPAITRLVFVEGADAAPQSLPWRERLITEWADAIYREAPSNASPDPPVAEATIAAIWGLIGDLTAAGRATDLPAHAARMASFILTPVLGAPRAAEAIVGQAA